MKFVAKLVAKFHCGPPTGTLKLCRKTPRETSRYASAITNAPVSGNSTHEELIEGNSIADRFKGFEEEAQS